jgi:hypothetical protein
VEGARIKEITAFVNRTTQVAGREGFAQWPAQAPDPGGVDFARFGLPAQVA